MILSRETILHPEFVKKYFSHPKYLLTAVKNCIEKAEDEMEEGLGDEWKYHLAKIHRMFKDYFKTEGIEPETYLLESSRRKTEV